MGYEGNDRRYGRERGYGGRDAGYRRDDYRNERGYERGGFDRDRGQERYGRGDRDPGGYDYDDRGFFDRAGDEVKSWFGDDEAERRRQADERHYRQEYERQQRAYGRGDRGIPYPWYAGVGFDGYGLGVPPAFGLYGPGPGYGTGYGDYDRGRGDRDEYERGRAYGREGARPQDQNYRSWRDRQMEAFDRDYDDYRREHQSQFDSHFGSWRETRQSQRQSLQRAQEHQEVVGSDGAHIGTVDHVRGDRILLAKNDKDAGGHHHSIPVAWIESVDDKVKINKTAEEAKRLWRDEEQNSAIGGDDRNAQSGSQGANLNRSFSGTY